MPDIIKESSGLNAEHIVLIKIYPFFGIGFSTY